jgi:hypothetical protein
LIIVLGGLVSTNILNLINGSLSAKAVWRVGSRVAWTWEIAAVGYGLGRRLLTKRPLVPASLGLVVLRDLLRRDLDDAAVLPDCDRLSEALVS